MCEWGDSSGINRNKGRSSRVSVSFHLLTKGATFKISTDIGTHGRPPVISLNKFLSFEMARMSGGKMIMTFLEDSKAGRRENISTIFVVKDVIGNLPIRSHRFHWRKTKTI
jgi:hypothetical protein